MFFLNWTDERYTCIQHSHPQSHHPKKQNNLLLHKTTMKLGAPHVTSLCESMTQAFNDGNKTWSTISLSGHGCDFMHHL